MPRVKKARYFICNKRGMLPNSCKFCPCAKPHLHPDTDCEGWITADGTELLDSDGINCTTQEIRCHIGGGAERFILVKCVPTYKQPE